LAGVSLQELNPNRQPQSQQKQELDHQDGRLEWLRWCRLGSYPQSPVMASLPETRATSPQSDIQYIRNMNLKRKDTETGTGTIAITPRTTKTEAMILSVPITITSPLAIKKIYSDNDINYNTERDDDNADGRVDEDEAAAHRYHQPELTTPDLQHEPPLQQDHQHYPQYSYHTL